MKTILLILFWFLLIANYSYSNEPCIYITYINGTIDTLAFSNNNLFSIVIDSNGTSIPEDSDQNPAKNISDKDKIRNNGNQNELSIFPNPVESSVHIYYESRISTEAVILISDLQGNTIKEINKFILTKGINYFSWDCTDNNSKRVSPGIYLFQLKFDSNIITKKIVLLK